MPRNQSSSQSLSPAGWLTLAAAFAGWMFDGFEMGGDYRIGATITLIYILGAVTIWYVPETKGRPLPD